ncbi:MAG: sulfur carrier protein ThiS [Thermodesulfobacteriota bacterium]
MTIHLNGKPYQTVGSEPKISQILNELQIDPTSVVVELNSGIIAPDRFSDTLLKQDDRLELIRFVGGG